MKTEMRHPLLVLSPDARRRLAKMLVTGLEAHTRADQQMRSKHGLLSAAACAVAGGGLYLGWNQLTGAGPGPFGLWYGALLGVQAVVGWALERGGSRLGPPALRWGVMAPYEVASAVKVWVSPPRFTPDRLVIAAGLLLAARRPVSYHLLRRLYARAYPQTEVEQAVTLLRHVGLLAASSPRPDQYLGEEAPIVVGLTDAGVAVLRELGVQSPEPRPRTDPTIAAHLEPVFAALEARPRRPAMPERDLPPVALATPEVVALEPQPAVVEAPPVELPRVTRHVEPDEETPEVTAPRQPLRLPWRPIAAVAAVALLVGAIALIAPTLRVPTWPTRPHLALTASLMPQSMGTVLQFNRDGRMLSSFGGSLFLSVPDRLDFKRPILFDDYDKATDCGFDNRVLKAVSMSPQGRFLWCELGGGNDGPRERCLVDRETKTVTHDLVARDSLFGLPSMVGWADASALLMSEEPFGKPAERWWLMDVTSLTKREVALPKHAKLLPMPVELGSMQLLGLDAKAPGEWDMTNYWLDGKRQFQKVNTVRVKLPETLLMYEPVTASLSPDKRYALMTLRPDGVQVPAQQGALAVVAMEDGTAEALKTAVPPLPDEPAFWGPDVRGGLYHFYFNGPAPDGVMPWSGELQVSAP